MVRHVHMCCVILSFRCTIPETNPEMDVYRIGTVLELVRGLALSLVEDGGAVKVSVQQGMGEGVFQVSFWVGGKSGQLAVLMQKVTFDALKDKTI